MLRFLNRINGRLRRASRRSTNGSPLESSDIPGENAHIPPGAPSNLLTSYTDPHTTIPFESSFPTSAVVNRDTHHPQDTANGSKSILEVTKSALEVVDPQETRLLNLTGQASSLLTPTVAVPSTKYTTWTKLKSLMEALDGSNGIFEPIKSAVKAIYECIDSDKTAVKKEEDCKELRNLVQARFEDLDKLFRSRTPSTTSPSRQSLAQHSAGLVGDAEMTPRLDQSTESIEFSKEAFEYYRRIQTFLLKLLQNYDTDISRIINERATEPCIINLFPARAAWYNSLGPNLLRRNRCALDTCDGVFVPLTAWANNDLDGRLYWLYGADGTGKTTIAYTFSENLDLDGKLAASFFCSRLLPSCRNIQFIVPSISYQLACFSYPFQSALARALEKNPKAYTQLPSEQFRLLIVEPFKQVEDIMPTNLVVVIDALDELEQSDGANQILAIILSQASSLPIKFLATSRTEPSVINREKAGEGMGLQLHNIEESIVAEDIKLYLASELSHLELSKANLEYLVEQSDLHFICAATIVRCLQAGDCDMAAQRLKQFLDASMQPTGEGRRIDNLYNWILRAIFDDIDREYEDNTQTKLALHTVICAQEPVTIAFIAGMLSLHEDSVYKILSPLLPVLFITEAHALVGIFHESFSEYQLDPDRSGAFSCDRMQHDTRLAIGCFNLINTAKPAFNICGLESSYVFDKDVPDLSDKINKNISVELFYACQHWALHLAPTEASQEMLRYLSDFLSTRLLLWMEILNLKGCNAQVWTGNFSILQRQSQNWSCSEHLRLLIQDAGEFLKSFLSTPSSLSTPHIYISALLFWPTHRPIARQYALDNDTGVKVAGSALARQETRQMVGEPLEGHVDSVTSVAFSPDARYIVSGSEDDTIRVWDAQTGAAVLQPLQGHSGGVLSVTYSPDGRHIVSGSEDNTIRVWDAHTGAPVLQPLAGHSGGVLSVTYSPDGRHIVSGSEDNTIRVWDAHTGAPVLQPLAGHSGGVLSVAYSPDTRHIVSGSEDNTIRIWNAHTGQMSGEPLRGHTDSVTSVAYSPDGTRIVSGSEDNTIRIWNAETGQMIGEPLFGHTSSVMSVAYSPDGSRIVSGSEDRTICLWRADGHGMLGLPVVGHTGAVCSVEFSPDGARFISSSRDQTIRIWISQDGSVGDEIIQGHTNAITSVAYSPNSNHIVSGSEDMTVCIWNADKGQLIGEPLRGHKEAVTSVTYTSDGGRIVSGSRDNFICEWNAESGQMIAAPYEGHTLALTSVAYSPDGLRMVSGSSDNIIRIWNARNGKLIGDPLEGHTDVVTSVAYSPDGTHIVSGSLDRTIRIWADPESEENGVSANSCTNIPLRVGSSDRGGPTSLSVRNLANAPSSTKWVLNQDGWVVVDGSKLLIWVPERFRGVLLRPQNRAVISREGSVSLDFSNTISGTSWHGFRPPEVSITELNHNDSSE